MNKADEIFKVITLHVGGVDNNQICTEFFKKNYVLLGNNLCYGEIDGADEMKRGWVAAPHCVVVDRFSLI